MLRKRDEHDGLDPAQLGADEAKTAFIDVIRHNTEVPGLVALFSRLSVDAADPDHPAHTYFLERSAGLRTLLTDSFSSDLRRSSLDPDTLARVIQAASDGLQLQWMIDPTVDMPGIMSALIDALHPPTPPAPPT